MLSANLNNSQQISVPLSFDPVDQKELFKPALKNFFIFMGLSLATIVIPGVHFVTVPLFFGLAFYQFYKIRKFKYRLDLTNFICPSCQNRYKQQVIHCVEKNATITCDNCGSFIILTES